MWTRKIQRKIKLIPSHQFYFSSYTERLTDGCWSPSRPSVFFVTRQYFITILDPYLDVQGGWLHGRLGHPLPTEGPHPVLQGLRRASECCQGDHLVLTGPLNVINPVLNSWGSKWRVPGGCGQQWRQHKYAGAQHQPQPVQPVSGRGRYFDINFNHGSLGLKKLQPQKCLNERQGEKKS